MIHKRTLALFFLCYLCIAAFCCAIAIRQIPQARPNMAAVNRILKKSAEDLKTGQFSPPDNCPYVYAVLDAAGTLLYQSSVSAPSDIMNAAAVNALILETDDTGQRATVLIDTGLSGTLSRFRLALPALIAFFALLILLPCLAFLLRLKKNVVKPFETMQHFARQIAAGNLDFPLPMDKEHVFGAFTESFDLMRTQLREARQREALASRSKKELVASLSHDIRTPVASIRSLSELLLAMEPPAAIRPKIESIEQKALQIDHLMSNMLQASLEDLGVLTVSPREESSEILLSMIARCDCLEKAEILPVPGCILYMDSLRMEQIISNLINNAYKYANTPLTVASELTAEGLRVEFMDYGSGVPEDELPRLCRKFYRGRAAKTTGADGSGLGLYISRFLIESMGGMLDLYNRPDGFSAVLYIPISGPQNQ